MSPPINEQRDSTISFQSKFVFNEEANIQILLERLRVDAKLAAKHDFELLFSDDGSTYRSYELLVQEAKQDRRIRVLRLSCNFGSVRNVFTNFFNAHGDAATELDGDL